MTYNTKLISKYENEECFSDEKIKISKADLSSVVSFICNFQKNIDGYFNKFIKQAHETKSTFERTQKLYIVLPHRIGDAILTVPVLVCFKDIFKNEYDVTLVVSNYMFDFFKKLNLFKVERFSLYSKIKTFFIRPDKIFFYLVSSKSIGYFSKYSYGQNNHKNYLKYSKSIPYLVDTCCDRFPYTDFYKKLKNEFLFSNVIINNFALCFELGATKDEIYDAIRKNYTYIDRNQNGNYIVCCLDAGYNKLRCSHRAYDIKRFINIAEDNYRTLGYKTVFIGLDKKSIIPAAEYLIDKRGNISITEMADIIKKSVCYIGNDTGPLHLANFMNKLTFGIYLEATPDEYGPIYTANNKAYYRPENFNALKENILSTLRELKENN